MDNITSDSVCLLTHEDEKLLADLLHGPEYLDEKKLLDDIPKLYNSFKLIIVNLFEYKPTKYESNLEFCEDIREKLDALQIPHYFMNSCNAFASCALATANVTVMKFNELVLLVNVFDECVRVMKLQYSENGYKIISNESIEFNQNESHQAIREKILGSSVYKRILLIPKLHDNANKKLFKTILKSKKLVILDRGMNMDKFVLETAKWYIDKSYTKFYGQPTSAKMSLLFYKINNEAHHLITVNFNDPLPIKETFTISKLFRNNVRCGYREFSNHMPEVHVIPSLEDVHEVQLTLIIDSENIQEIVTEGIIKNSIKFLPKSLDKQMTKKIPVIGFYDYSSVICVCKESGYKFLDSWNGLYGKELIIEFDKENPTFCETALEVFKTKPTYAVYDLIKVMSMAADNIQTDKIWKFTITKDSDHPVLLEFDSYDGTKKAASPAFLMAMLLKQHLKAIKKETGEKPTEIGIQFFQDFTDDERAHVEAGLKEACELLKIDFTFNKEKPSFCDCDHAV